MCEPLQSKVYRYARDSASCHSLLCHFLAVAAAEPPELDKIPGVVSKKQFEAKWSKRLAKAMRMPHPLAPDPVSSDESDYSTSSDDSEDERELARKRREEAKARLKAAKKRMLEEQGLEPDSDDDEEGRSLEQIWYTKVKQPILQRIYGRRKATLIQSWYRGLKAQWHLRTLRRVVQRQGRDAAVRVIQNCWQGHLDRVYVRQRRIRMHRAARSIQKGWHFYQFWQVIREKVRGGGEEGVKEPSAFTYSLWGSMDRSWRPSKLLSGSTNFGSTTSFACWV